MQTLTLNEMKQLTIDQYERARSRALDRVKARIGEKPTRRMFEREAAPVATALDWIALIVFAAALAISSLHIVAYMGQQAAASWHAPSNDAGIIISPATWAIIHQIGAILLAESAAILFAVMHSMSSQQRQSRKRFRWFSVPLLLALVAAAFVLIANLSSGVNLLVSIMPPAFTLGISVRLEALIVESIRRRADVDQRYLDAMAIYEAASADPEQHPEFKRLLQQEVWTALVALKTNEAFRDAPAGFKRAAVFREMSRDTWIDSSDHTTEFEREPLPPQPRRKGDEPGAPGRPFGNSAQEQAEPEFMLTMPADSAPIARGNGNGHHES